jgi:hypothetical protein
LEKDLAGHVEMSTKRIGMLGSEKQISECKKLALFQIGDSTF